MDKKKILIGLGILAVAGIGFYFWNKSKNATDSGVAEGGSEKNADTTKSTEAPAEASSESPANASATTKAPLNTRKEKKKACGRKPMNKNKRAEWQKCVDAGGNASFEGDFDQFQRDYMDFEGQVENQFMYSEFENSLNLDI